MLNSLSSFCLLSICLLQTQFSFAQKKEENIGTEVVNVVKTYTPTISDAFKVKETPALEEEGNAKKESIKYTIFSFPVASTFTPSKGKAEGIEKEEQAHLFQNYATFGGGNYGVLNGELFLNHNLNSADYVGAILSHFSSQGGIKGVEVSDNFNETAVDLTFGTNRKNLSLNLDLGYQNQIYNWYGLPASYDSLTSEERAALLRVANEGQSYNNLYFGGKITFSESVFKVASLKLNHFSDAFGSSENRFYLKPSFELNINEKLIKTNAIVDYLGGSFKGNYWNTNSIQYGYANFGVVPTFELNEQGWKVNIGAALFYSLDTKNNNNQLLIYPKINASFNVVDDLMLFYVGAEGNLEQNTYYDFANENPFVSPRLTIAPTDKQYDLFAGLKGKLTNNISYNIRGSYVNERNKALFKSNEYANSTMKEGYTLGNSFEVVYDDMKTLSFYGEFKADLSEKVSLVINGTFSSYTNDIQKEAWNLPAIKLDSKIDFNITEKWYAGANVFFVGERKEEQSYMTSLVIDPRVVKNLAGYFDVNTHVGFKYSEKLTAFLRANNITNQNYQKWQNYPVQGLQVVLGANYKFDF